MTTPSLKAIRDKARERLEALLSAIEEDIQDLETEQSENEEERENFDPESGDPEPDEVDHQALIDVLELARADVQETCDVIADLVFEVIEETKE